MSECFEFSSSMTGSTNTGPLQPQKDSSPVPARSLPFDHHYITPESPARRGHCQRPSRKMTLTSANGQPIQLTPLWEHVVRTRKFPTEVDTRLTFLEISERLRDPEWEVRQHALRVLIDVLPTLNTDIVDKVMQPVVPELVNNLGHPAPAVRKGALDAFRVFLIHSRDRENTIKRILQDGLNRSEVQDSFQTNVTTGVILSVPSLLFPSSSSPSPDPKLVKNATIALASRLAQVPHQEAVLKSLIKIRDAVGTKEFENYLEDYDNKLKRNIEILSKIYNIKTDKRDQRKIGTDVRSAQKDSKEQDKKWESDSDTSGIAEEEDEVNNGVMPSGRVVLETEIKFNEETAITMTILEEKEDSEKEQDDESGTDVKNDADTKDSSADRRKTSRRVHFGGEIVKLRTPDSDDTESINATPKTRIPVPVSPATKMPTTRPRPSSQPCSPRRDAGKPKRTSRSVSSSPKREVYTHNAELSPKKSILTRTSSPLLVARSVEQTKKKKGRQEDRKEDVSSNEKHSESNGGNENISKSFELAEESRKDIKLLKNNLVAPENSNSSKTEKQSGDNSVRNSSSIKSEDPAAQNKVENFAEGQTKKNVEEKSVLSENIRKADSAFGSLVKSAKNEANRAKADQDIDDRVFGEDSRVKENDVAEKDVTRLQSYATSGSKHDNVDGELRNVGGETSDRDKTSVNEKNGNFGRVLDDGEHVPEEPSWEELGLVNQEVLEDLHNKDDWRARVRGLERVASALRTSSALIAIEPRLGSLLHAVLGSERSCRVAAAGLAVAKVVVAGVSEEALKNILPQLAWGLSRQGGPSAAQLARIVMLRLRPALLLEQLLQPQCLNARNARTRENTLQLLIFSLVTFPSTEFKVDTVANKVAKMVRDRRRRVRQAALDTLAVLAQIYESEEVLAAGKRAAEGYHDGEAMISAIRARLARKSLPLVSADGLVMYGLQISPTVQIATGPDVDWIVAGSGSVSPGIGRTKGQIIATRSEKEKLSRNENASNYENPWIERPNFVALGVGMRPKTEQPVVWQILPQNQDIYCEDPLNLQVTRSVNTAIRNGEGSNFKLRNQARIPATARDSANYRNIVEENFERRVNEIGNKSESRIPVLYHRDRGSKNLGHDQDKSELESITINSKRRLNDTDNSSSDVNSQEESIRTFGIMYHRRKKNQHENNTSTQYDSYRSIKNLSNTSIDYNNVMENTNQNYSDANSRTYKKFMEKDRFSKRADIRTRCTRSSSTESDHRSLPRNVQQQTFVMHDMYSTNQHREGRFADENSFQPLQSALTLTHLYNKLDFNKKAEENSDRNNLSRTRFYCTTKDAAVQKVNEAELISSNGRANEHFPAISNDPPYRRRLRSLSPSQLYHRQQFGRMASNEIHALSMFDIDKAVYEEEYNEKNKHHFLPEERYRLETLDAVETQFEDDHELSSSDTLETDCHQEAKQDVQDTQEDSDSKSSSLEGQTEDAAFNVITGQTSPSGRDTVDFVITLDQKIEAGAEPATASIEEDASKDWSSEEESKSRHESPAPSRNSERSEFHEEAQNESEFSTSDEPGKTEERISSGRRSVASVLMSERIDNESLQTSSDILKTELEGVEVSPLRRSGSPKKSSRSSSRNSDQFETLKSPRCNSRGSPHKLSFGLENEVPADSSEDRAASSIAQCENECLESVEPSQSRRESKTVDLPTIIIASRPHSTEVSSYVENHVEDTAASTESDNNHRFIDESTVNNSVENGRGRDSFSETNTEPGILKIEPQPVEAVTITKRITSKVPRVTGRFRGNPHKRSTERPEKSKPIVQQCFSQLDSKDWEVTMKGLKTLSQIAKQQPEYLDVCAAATISRLLGRQIKSLRSQVARTACLAAGDIFSSQIRGIDQDFDDIAGPLLQRTADTNRFLRADSNAALDLMIEHLPPHKTILIIVQRGASHQNAIVRAATARLLANIVDRIGPDHAMILPKDVKDKLLSTGARLLMDGNLDARNHAKKMFRVLMACEGFRKALTDAVPETTLRHIDKTLKTL